MKKKYIHPILYYRRVYLRQTFLAASNPVLQQGESDTNEDNLAKPGLFLGGDDSDEDFIY